MRGLNEKMEINEQSKIKFLEKLAEFNLSEEELNKIETKRNFFREHFSAEKITNLDEKHFFQGKGIKEGNLTYELEWNSKELGGIGGGSVYKFGHVEDFNKIKKFVTELISANSDLKSFYINEELSDFSKKIIKKSLEIKGVSRVFVGKLLSIYFPKIFIPIYGHQELFLSQLYQDYKAEFFGVELFFKNNLLLLKYKEKYAPELNSDEFTRLLYEIFYVKKDNSLLKNEEEIISEYKIDALEVDHYQSLIHRNFKYLFNNKLIYYDEEYQNQHKGHFDTGEIGILDFLAIDKNNNFVVIELKRDANDKTLGQILRYMGWVKVNLCKKTQDVKGIIIAESKDNRLDYSLKILNTVEFRKMKLNVEIEVE